MIKLTLLNIAIFQGIVIGTILLKSPFFKSKANKYLAFAIFSLSYSLLNIVMDITNVFKFYPILKFIDKIDATMLFPVFIFFFVLHQVDHPKKHSKKLRWLYAPFIISTIILSLISSLDVNEEASLDFTAFLSIILLIIFFLLILFFIPFILSKTYKCIQYSKNVNEKKWLTNLWYFEVTLLSSLIVFMISSPFFIEHISNALQIIALFATLLTHWIAYSGVYKLKLANEQEHIRELLSNLTPKITPDHIEDTLPTANDIKIIKEEKSLSKENTYFQKLETLCKEQKIYRDSSLDRNAVAKMLNISPSYVSQIVNSITGDNFASYINRYRVEELKVLLLDEEFDNYSLLAIGLECGFSSKTTFYNSFKKITGMTPNAYKKANK